MKKTRLIIFTILLIISCSATANDEEDTYFFRRVDYQQGLSNSAVLCLFQDDTELMWFGTYDGVNCWDGKTMEVYRSDFKKNKTLSNNVIRSISQADNNCLWISTHLGISRFSQKTKQVVGNYDLRGGYHLHSNAKGNTWMLSDKHIYYYNTFHQCFVAVQQLDTLMDVAEYRSFVTDDGFLWLFSPHTGQVCHYSVSAFDTDSLSAKLVSTTTNFHPKPIEHVFYQDGILCFVDCDKDLYMYDISRKSKIYIRNLGTLMRQYGVITGIVPFYEDFIIAFRTNGLMRLRVSHRYEEEIVDRNLRIYGLYRDPRQGMLWIASDGQGAVMYAKKHSIATNLMLNRMSTELSRQVRSLLTDKYGGLWLGTKGDGVLHLPYYASKTEENFHQATVYAPGKKQEVASYVKWNHEFQAYKLVQSRYMDGFWVGAGNPGLFYYSFTDDALHTVENLSEHPAYDIHGIYEENDSVLYVATAGNGFYKMQLEKRAGSVRVLTQKRYRFYYEQQELSMFFPMLSEGDSILWLGSREKGLIRFEKKTEQYRVISLEEKLYKSVDDVLSLCRAADGKMYVGTTSGLVSLTFHGTACDAIYIGREQGLPNDMIHGVLEDDNGFLWLGTNRGLVKYNPKNGTSHSYYYTAGVNIGEFSDDAYYRCPYTGRLFFGGIDGLSYLDNRVVTSSESSPDLLLRRLWIGRTEVNLNDYYADSDQGLKLRGNRLSFSLAFTVPDYLTGDEVEYAYILEGYDKKWSLFSHSNEASYTEVPAGNYIFKVCYKRDVLDTDYRYLSLPVRILPPWYRSGVAYAIYLLLAVALLGYLYYLLRRHVLYVRLLKRTSEVSSSLVASEEGRTDRDTLERLTLIYHACDQLRAENISYEQRSSQVELIRELMMGALFRPELLTSEKLFSFYPTTFVLSARMCIRELSLEVLRVLSASGTDVSIVYADIAENLTFPVYKNALRCILYYCYRWVCTARSSTGTAVTAREEKGCLLLEFSSADDALKQLYEQLTGAACYVSVKNDVDLSFGLQLMLGFVQSVLRQWHVSVRYSEAEVDSHCLLFSFEAPQTTDGQSSEKQPILLLEDRQEMVWFFTGLFSDTYSMHSVSSLQVAFEEMRRLSPAVFLVDMSMYAGNEFLFMEHFNKHRSLLAKTVFIPMLTWKVNSNLQRDLIKWADSYIVLPYDILFLKEEVQNALYGKRDAKRIYFEDLGGLAGQITCTSTEQADFARRLLLVIEQNLEQENLSSTLIAERMAMSSSQFYRKFKEIFTQSPGDLIKNYRMEKAARLLREEELSIQEIIADVGISSRSYFYKEFARKFGTTPKEYREQSKKE